MGIVSRAVDPHASSEFELLRVQFRPEGLFERYPSMKENDGKQHRYYLDVPGSMLIALFPGHSFHASANSIAYIPALPVLRTLMEVGMDTDDAYVSNSDDIDDKSNTIIQGSSIDDEEKDGGSIISISDESESENSHIVIDLTTSDTE